VKWWLDLLILLPKALPVSIIQTGGGARVPEFQNAGFADRGEGRLIKAFAS